MWMEPLLKPMSFFHWKNENGLHLKEYRKETMKNAQKEKEYVNILEIPKSCQILRLIFIINKLMAFLSLSVWRNSKHVNIFKKITTRKKNSSRLRLRLNYHSKGKNFSILKTLLTWERTLIVEKQQPANSSFLLNFRTGSTFLTPNRNWKEQEIPTLFLCCYFLFP